MGVFPYDGPTATKDLAQQTTTASYETLDEAVDISDFHRVAGAVENLDENSNSIHYRVLGSADGGDNWDFTLVSETSIAAGSVETFTVDQPLTDIKVEVKDNAGTDDAVGRLALDNLGEETS